MKKYKVSKNWSTAVLLMSIVIIAIILFIAMVQYSVRQQSIQRIDSFDECAAAGYPIMESYPEQCATPDGRSFTKDISKSS